MPPDALGETTDACLVGTLRIAVVVLHDIHRQTFSGVNNDFAHDLAHQDGTGRHTLTTLETHFVSCTGSEVTMATNAAFRNILQDQIIGLNNETAREVVDAHGINTMKRLTDLTHQAVTDLASLIRKTKVLGIPPMPDRLMSFPASSVRMVYLAAVIAKNMERVSRTVVPADFLVIMGDADHLEMHE